ncbi:MAG: hypothetical protein ACPG4X_14615 [Pikeienuella sp.]
MSDTREPIDVQTLVEWAIGAELADLFVEALDGPQRYLGGVSADGCFGVERYGKLGTFIDYSGSGGDAVANCHEDAELVYRQARDILDGPTLHLVISCARKKTFPVWDPFPVVTLAREYRWRGRKRVVRVRSLPNGAKYCRLLYRDRGPEIEHYRTLYLWWWDALRQLEYRLMQEDELTRWRLLNWRQPREPWRNDS